MGGLREHEPYLLRFLLKDLGELMQDNFEESAVEGLSGDLLLVDGRASQALKIVDVPEFDDELDDGLLVEQFVDDELEVVSDFAFSDCEEDIQQVQHLVESSVQLRIVAQEGAVVLRHESHNVLA